MTTKTSTTSSLVPSLLNITIWEYTGLESDSTQDLLISGFNTIDASLDRVEGKIDTLIEQ